MKPTFLIKTFSALSLMATLAVVVGTGVTQSAQAQTPVESQIEAEANAEFCIDAQSQDIGFGDRTVFFEASRDIDVSAAQSEEFEAVVAGIALELSRIDEKAEVTGSSGGLMFTPKAGVAISDEQ